MLQKYRKKCQKESKSERQVKKKKVGEITTSNNPEKS